MKPDFELVRLTLLYLDALERSPPEPIFIAIPELAACCRSSIADVEESLALLQARGFIEGPGAYDAARHIFRKLTGKGKMLAAALRDPKDWEEAKSLYLRPAR